MPSMKHFRVHEDGSNQRLLNEAMQKQITGEHDGFLMDTYLLHFRNIAYCVSRFSTDLFPVPPSKRNFD